MSEVAVYTDKKLHPAVQDVLGEVFAEYKITDVELWNAQTTSPLTPTLVLGTMPDAALVNCVKTLSQKQILANPAAVSELSIAVSNLLAPPSFNPMKWSLAEAGENVDDFFKAWKKSGAVVVDIETGGDIETMLPEETWLLSVAITNGKLTLVLSEEWLADKDNRQKLANFLTSGVKLVAHNMKFDFRTLTAQLGRDIRGHFDTMIFHHVLNPGAKEHGLKPLARKYLGAPDWDEGSKQYAKGKYKNVDERPGGYPEDVWNKYFEKFGSIAIGFENIPKPMLYEYNAYDVYWTWHLMEFLTNGAEDDERVQKITKFELAASNFLQGVEAGGIAVDLDYLTELGERFAKEKEEHLAKLRELTDNENFNPNSPKQVKTFYENNGFPLKSTAEDKLLEIKFSEDQEILQEFTDTLLAARRVTKMKGTYVDGILKRTHGNIVHPSFLVHGTSTGRLSSKGPNIQNIPRDEEGEISLRRIFVPRDIETRTFVNVDYSQAELRVMACMSNDEYLISLFQPGMPDFFDSLMPTAFPREDLDALDKATKKNMRAKLKGVIYGMSYGRMAAAIAKALEMPVIEAQSIITNYFKAAPSLYDWREWVKAVAVSPEETLVSSFGRYYQAEVVTGRNRVNVENSGLAFLPQSTASDMCLTAAMEVAKWIKDYNGYIVALVHDAILLDVPKEHADEVGHRVQKEMQASGDKIFNGRVLFDTDYSKGSSWEGL